MDKDEALKLAYEALEFDGFYGTQKQRAITAIKQALAAQPAPVQEPVAYEYGNDVFWHDSPDINDYIRANGNALVYATPPAAQPAQAQGPYSAPVKELWSVAPKAAAQPAVQPVPLADGVLKITMQLDGLEVSRLLSLDVIRTSNAPEVDRHSRQAWLDLQKAAHGITKGQP
jgi:hypothetical protein